MRDEPTPVLEFLDWDTEFFGFRIARLITEKPLTETAMEDVLATCKGKAVRCLYALAESGDVDTIELLECNGFRLEDLRLTLIRRPVTGETIPEGIRRANPGDLDRLRQIARESHRDTRFYKDKHFPRERCDDLYGTWIEKSCTSNYADVVFVAELDGVAAGYVTCDMLGPKTGRIGLLAAGAPHRGRGIGQLLIRGALGWFAEQKADEVITITQGGNVSAVRAYERCGFVSERAQLWFHRWFDDHES